MEIKKFLKTAGLILLSAVGVWLFVAYLLPLALPFLLSFLLAVITEPPALFLMEKGRLPRWAAGAVCTLAAYCILFGAGFLFARCLTLSLSRLTARLPQALEGIAPMLEHLRSSLLAQTRRLPDGLGEGLSGAVENFFDSGAGLLERLPETLFSLISALAGKLPGLALFAVTTVIASFMTAAQLPLLRRWLSRVLPRAWRQKVTTAWTRTKTTAAGWLKAQGKLLCVTFFLTLSGLLLLGAKRPLIAALGVTAVDALPVFGSGTVLLPWATACFLAGNTLRGVGFLLLYGTVAITRITLEPKFVGRQTGLPPIVTLAALYVGGKLCGVGGMILFPVAASVAGQFIKLSKP